MFINEEYGGVIRLTSVLKQKEITDEKVRLFKTDGQNAGFCLLPYSGKNGSPLGGPVDET